MEHEEALKKDSEREVRAEGKIRRKVKASERRGDRGRIKEDGRRNKSDKGSRDERENSREM